MDNARQMNSDLRLLGHGVTRADRRLLVHQAYEKRLRSLYGDLVLETVIIVELKDGRIGLVEYKMDKMASDPEEQHKKAVGELWAARSQGRRRFAWVVDKAWHVLNAERGSQATSE